MAIDSRRRRERRPSIKTFQSLSSPLHCASSRRRPRVCVSPPSLMDIIASSLQDVSPPPQPPSLIHLQFPFTLLPGAQLIVGHSSSYNNFGHYHSSFFFFLSLLRLGRGRDSFITLLSFIPLRLCLQPSLPCNSYTTIKHED